MNNSYKPFVFKLDDSTVSFKSEKDKDSMIVSNIISQPKVSLGFHYYLHRTKNAMEITKNLETTNKFYYVVNPFEHKISDYKDDLTSATKTFLNLKKDEPSILSRAFYKMWEMIYYFDLASKKDLTYAALAEGPGSFLQAVLKFREQYNFDLNKDRYFSVTIHPEDGKNIEMSKQFIGFYNKSYPELLNVHKTNTKSKSQKLKSISDGDITKIKTISLFKKDISKSSKYADLITADGGFDWDDENYQEQEAYKLVLGEIIAALRTQNKGGHFVLKLFETFTISSLKMIYILKSFYGESYICKPLFSRESNSEKYIVCKNFKFDQKSDKKVLDSKISKLEYILENIPDDLYLQDIFPDMDLPQKFVNDIRFINIEIANKQQIMINKIVIYIKNNNYYGDKYHEYKENQIDATNWWIKTFFTKSLNKDIEKKINEVISFNEQEEIQFSKKLV